MVLNLPLKVWILNLSNKTANPPSVAMHFQDFYCRYPTPEKNVLLQSLHNVFLEPI